MKKFKEYFFEDTSYTGGVLGPEAVSDHSGIENTDWYAPGDYRIPKGRGTFSRAGLIKKKRKKKPKKK